VFTHDSDVVSGTHRRDQGASSCGSGPSIWTISPPGRTLPDGMPQEDHVRRFT